jgi:ubiquinone/menaquinone biosynthesis C-methylase UbiE
VIPTKPFLAKVRGLFRRARQGEPPPALGYVGGVDFSTGRETLRHLIDVAGLTPQDRVLDIGCGIGRIAMPLQDYLADSAGYSGFDIVRSGIDWCRENIRRPDFDFSHIDVYNLAYNPAGKIAASELVFPFADRSFTFVVANSVFTHMLPADTERYFAEIARVSRPGMRGYITAFLLTEETLRRQAEGRAAYNFRHVFDGYRTLFDRLGQERAVAYEQDRLVDLAQRAGLVVRAVSYGCWSTDKRRAGDDGRLYQDVLVIGKAEAA